MRVLIDTSVWSLALRRRQPKPDPFVRELLELIREGRVAICGPIRQEILSGVKAQEQFLRLRTILRAFEDLPLEVEDYEEAASHYNTCRAAGLQGSNTDFLLCSLATRRGLPLFTLDGDFKLFTSVLGLTLHEPRFEEPDEQG